MHHYFRHHQTKVLDLRLVVVVVHLVGLFILFMWLDTWYGLVYLWLNLWVISLIGHRSCSWHVSESAYLVSSTAHDWNSAFVMCG